MSDEDYIDDEWEPSGELCPDCGNETEIRGWWDDPPSLGGACIGTQHQCTACGWSADR